MAKNKDKDIEIVEKDIPQSVLKEILKDGKDHFNYIEPQDYKVSTGSLNLDLETDGGIHPTIIRCAGPAETGKTSFSLQLAKNFLEVKNRRGVYFLSDKELSHEMVKRSGVKFVESLDDWVDGTCYVIRTNVYETVCNTIKKLIANVGTLYIFILDSMDNFAPKSALEGDFGDSFAKGGTGAISSHFFRCFNILLPRLGHLTIMISQARDAIVIGRQAAPTWKQMNSSGGRAIEHAVSWAFEFSPAMNSKEDMFWEGEPYKGKKLGHNCIIQFKKSTNEKTGTKVKYPIIYGRANGKSIWIEREIFDQLLIWGMLKRKVGWLEFIPNLLEELIKIEPSTPKQIQGEENFIKFLESNPKLTEFLYKKFQETLSNNESIETK